MKSFFVCAILSIVAAEPAMAETFTRDGTTYTYGVMERSGYKVIAGVADDTGDAFRLVVKGDKVSGQFGSKQVQFRISTAVAVRAGEPGMVVAAK